MNPTFNDAELDAQLDRDGFVVIPFLDEDEVRELRDAYEEIGIAPGDPERACISTFHTYDADYKQQVTEVIHRVFGPHLEAYFSDQRVLPANYLTKWPGGMSGFGLHQDLALVDESQHRSVEVWCALTDTNADNGELWMVPGSHQWTRTIRGIHAFSSPYAGLEQRIIQHHAVPVPIKAGEAVVFNHATLHFSYPNKTDEKRLVAIVDLIPNGAQHLHYFGDGQGTVDIYEIDESFWVDNSPFTLHEPPADVQKIGQVEGFAPAEFSEEDLDRLVAEGKAVYHEDPTRKGALNAGRAWCHRCGTTEMEGSPNRWSGNVTMLCESCAAAEPVLARA